ncbi:MAG: mannose-1-phosphate guanylyltransferase/mannose-6-phosphate isomerase [Spirochaetes bacterium GWF1_31_7]|nr:MAG: mannose-1-phosphate guanylyltransferase/mannose-6-phosphate isomerase [Spirochaetes bacterium GWE1_32_154]OHD47036.1 MAG: mannose-1-phosphate guanylyltransferase/mannose-6-phosphate isomerase [Spirochaetes bacterium GWE2_31_10]OHD51985.1 MAG: mannose-1-phosphate guanylyltransferase/mannose-6-phosphate isomerase [Spirochaetes bacterium GWF1_31_7]OHD76423.1 MAG: mannose-1-phosphate guanylyltransferase/mannose-6-phosphate isomerase [Spirochaetes bacterium RIFOXYB1_FULL_32_8]HBD94257.1 mann
MKYVILAGGSGSRLWPMSRKNTPKQFINLVNDKTMLQNTVERVTKQDGEDIFVISNNDSKFIINDQISSLFKKFNEKNIIIEPCARNTAPAIAYGCLFFEENDIIAILSSDHHITNPSKFNEILTQAEEIARENYIVTLGIIPDSPRTGYGYIKKSDTTIKSGYKVEKFVEKPDLVTAEKYVKDGGFYWNAGIFIFKVSVLLNELKRLSPELFENLLKIKEKISNKKEILISDFERFKKISIDYAVMEKSDKICVIPSEFGWSDVGSFKSLYDILPKDDNNNVFNSSDILSIDTKNTFIMGTTRKIATIGLNDITIIDTPDALLVASSNSTEKVKNIVEILEKEEDEVIINQKTIYRPWGSYTILDEGPNYKVKQLYIRPEQSISLQYHHHRSENWTVASGIAEVTKGDEIITLKPSDTVFIPATVHHRLHNPSKVRFLKIIEVQTGEYLGEDDIIRIKDNYKRV